MSQNRRTSNLLGGLGGMAKSVGAGVSQVGTGVIQGTRVVGRYTGESLFFVKSILRKNFVKLPLVVKHHREIHRLPA